MKPFYKATLFLVLVFLLEIVFRNGLLIHFMPFQLPYNANILIGFTGFTICCWFITKRFCKWDNMSLKDLGISFLSNNRKDFFYGFVIGVILWGIVSLAQSYFAGFSWVLRPNVSLVNIFYGLLFIFIADLGTELFYRGYPLTRYKDSFGYLWAIIIMFLFVSLKSYSPGLSGELLFYALLIPGLHTIFFSIIYFKTKRLGAAVGLHTGANFITISIFDLRVTNPNQAIPSGIFDSNVAVDTLSLTAVQMPWVVMASLLSIVVYFWWQKE
ncbi:MAG: hypothetical protein BM564_03450 [Bacteroidetes bacterium MedPE-SWsnd-G2]|nr:MAG: hypothetical protein BM564_03450 [Bacteroidetes bacterium MedPE-SWsnd-G2]